MRKLANKFTPKMESERRVGKVVALCISTKPGIPKYPVEGEVIVTPVGISGDFHSGPWRKTKIKSGERKENDRQVSLVAKEVVDQLNQEFGISIPIGGLAENILVSGLGDLSDLKPQDKIEFSGGVILKVTRQNNPCNRLDIYHPELKKLILSRRGVVAQVLQTGVLSSGEMVKIG
jgi:MOSC domain-containing protein YiiM